MERVVNLEVINKMKIPKNVNLKTINGISLVVCGDGCDDIEVGGSSGSGSGEIVDMGYRMTGVELMDMGLRV